MALSITYDDPDAGLIDITGSVVYGKGNIQLQTKAEQGAVSTVTLTVDDPFGAYNFQGLRPLYFEDDEADPVRLATYWIFTKRITRGSYRTGAARTWALDLQDLNHILWQKVMAGNDTDRPAESDVERVQWLLSTGEAGLIGDTTTYVFTDDPVDMDANPDTGYNGQMFQNVIDDCAQQSGKNYFMLDVDDGGGGFTSAVWYGADSLDEFVSAATISNVLADVDGETVFWGNISGQLDKDPSRIYSGVFANYDGGYTYQSNPDTITDFANRDTTASWPNVKTHTKAVARATRYLETLNTEEEVVTVTIYSMRPDQANVFRAGQLVHDVTFTHYPDWQGGRDVRIITKTLTDQAVGLYSMELELTPLPPVPPPIDCADVIADLETEKLGPAYSTVFTSASFVPAAPSTTPSLVIAGFFGGTGFTSAGHASELDSDFTNLWKRPVLPSPDGALIVVGGYKHVSSGAPGTFTAGFFRTDGRCFFACNIPTASTAPVQFAEQNGTGSSVTFGSDPIEGNIWVMFRSTSLNGVAGDNSPATYGWTLIDRENGSGHGYPGGGVQSMSFGVWAKCIGAAESKTQTVGSFAYSHWSHVVEVELI